MDGGKGPSDRWFKGRENGGDARSISSPPACADTLTPSPTGARPQFAPMEKSVLSSCRLRNQGAARDRWFQKVSWVSGRPRPLGDSLDRALSITPEVFLILGSVEANPARILYPLLPVFLPHLCSSLPTLSAQPGFGPEESGPGDGPTAHHRAKATQFLFRFSFCFSSFSLS